MHEITTLAADGQLVFPDEFPFGTWEDRPLWWRVLEVADGQVWAFARQAVAERPYANAAGATTWADSDLRAWLNGDFAQTAFGEAEAACLVAQPLAADANPEFGTDEPAAPGQDRVFCLSYDQVVRFLPAESRRALVGENGMWWLRTPGGAPGFGAYVHNNGWINAYGYNVDEARVCVRPAVVLDLQALLTAAGLDAAADVVRAGDYGQELMLEVMETEDLASLAPFVEAFGVDESWESFLVEQLESFAEAGDAGRVDALFDLVGTVEFTSGALCKALGEGHAAVCGTLIRHGARLDGRCAKVPLVNDTPELRKARKEAYGADRSWYGTALEGQATGHMVRVLTNQGLLAKADWRGLLCAAAADPEQQDLFAWMLCPDHDPVPGISARWAGKHVAVVQGSAKRDVPVSSEGLRWLWHPGLCQSDPESVRVMAPHLGFRDLDEKGELLNLLARNGWNRELRALLDVYRMFSVNQLAAAVTVAREHNRRSTADMLLTLLRSIGAGKVAAEVE
ncbi:MAG: DUF6273 domain-containing protein [Coriobacteriia bacterium]|nr:DUF6273 domain-containing protein [Coriobacteriia bacterium]